MPSALFSRPGRTPPRCERSRSAGCGHRPRNLRTDRESRSARRKIDCALLQKIGNGRGIRGHFRHPVLPFGDVEQIVLAGTRTNASRCSPDRSGWRDRHRPASTGDRGAAVDPGFGDGGIGIVDVDIDPAHVADPHAVEQNRAAAAEARCGARNADPQLRGIAGVANGSRPVRRIRMPPARRPA